jgi:small-conductance mechanosensitive channel
MNQLLLKTFSSFSDQFIYQQDRAIQETKVPAFLSFLDKIWIYYLFRIILPIFLVLGCFLMGIFFERKVIKYLKELSQKIGFKLTEVIIDSIHGISVIWFVLAGLFFALQSLPLNRTATLIITKALLAIFLGSATFIIARFSVGLLKLYTTKDKGISPLTSLFEFLIQVTIFSIGVLIILQSIGIEITPLLTAFGVGGVSIGLALQTTLANLMSGINIITSGKVKPGNYLQLKSGEAGYVIDVELKYTIIQEITNNILVIPNAKLISSSFRNYSLPDKSMLIPVEVGVSYDSDLEKVEDVTLSVAKEIIKFANKEELEYQPFIRYNGFDYFSINLTVYLKLTEEAFFDHVKLKHEFIKRLHQRYHQEGIKIPFPIQSAYIPPFQQKDQSEENKN